MTNTQKSLPNLKRYPSSQDPTLRAWDAADERLIADTHQTIASGRSLLVANDEFGSLATSLASDYRITHLSDSLLSQIATHKNWQRNQQQETHSIQYLRSTDPLPKEEFSLVIIRPSKNLRLLEYQLASLAHNYPGLEVWCGVMQKHITSGLKKILERWLIEPEASLAVKKARIIRGQLTSSTTEPDQYHYFSHHGLTIANQPNVFSSESIDIGARFLIDHFPRSPFRNICDLGCGNGVLSAVAASLHSEAKIVGLDESFMAIASAEETFRYNQLTNGHFLSSNVFSALKEDTFDLILCNPPFHQQRLVNTDTAKLMIRLALHRLNIGGELWIIANRHLGYRAMMKKIFNQVESVSSNQKFVILRGVV